MIWVITEEFNDYNQHGGYFVCAFDHSPTYDDLITAGFSKGYALRILSGGGRFDDEYHWFEINEVAFGKEIE